MSDSNTQRAHFHQSHLVSYVGHLRKLRRVPSKLRRPNHQSPIHQSTNPLIHQSTNPPIHQSTNPPIHQSTNPPIHQSPMRTHRGINAFIRFIRAQANEASPGWKGTVGFILRISEDCAFIRLRDIWHPLRFFKQMSGKPPIRFGTQGFKKELLDDQNPARHYIAFVFVGFWLPYPLAAITLWLWEGLGFLRYGFFSQSDMDLGWIGIAHGAQVRRHGPNVLPDLIEQGLREREG